MNIDNYVSEGFNVLEPWDDDYSETPTTPHEAVSAKTSSKGISSPDHAGGDVTPLKLLSYAEMAAMPAPNWLIDGLLQERSAALMYGKSNAFKSFVAIDIALSVATGRSWQGHDVQQGKVLYLATEGANGVGRLRVPAWFDYHDISPEIRENVHLLNREVYLDDEEHVSQLIAAMQACGPFKLLILDIFGGCMSGSEIEDRTARAWVHGVQRILRETGATVLAVAHVGWKEQHRARMHTHFWGSFDTRLQVEGDKDAMTTTLSVERHKDADSSGEWCFKLEKSGESLVPIYDPDGAPSKSDKKLTGTQRKALEVLDEATEHEGTRYELDGAFYDGITIDRWRELCKHQKLSKDGKDEAEKKAFQRALKDLQDKDLVLAQEGYALRKITIRGDNGDITGQVPQVPGQTGTNGDNVPAGEAAKDGTDRDTPL